MEMVLVESAPLGAFLRRLSRRGQGHPTRIDSTTTCAKKRVKPASRLAGASRGFVRSRLATGRTQGPPPLQLEKAGEAGITVGWSTSGFCEIPPRSRADTRSPAPTFSRCVLCDAGVNFPIAQCRLERL